MRRTRCSGALFYSADRVQLLQGEEIRTIILIIVCSLLVIPCKAEPNCTEEISGDVSGDCKVDFNDFTLLAVDWYRIENLEPNDSSIAQEWLARYDGSGSGTDWPLAMAIDESGNVYVTGESYGSGTDQDYVTIKYCPDSNIPAWIKRYNGSWNKRDVARAITLDSLGNIIVTGLVLDSTTKEDYVTIKYDPDGNEIWVATYNGSDDNQDEPYAVEVDGLNNVYVAGKSMNSSLYDYATVKYDPNGNELWVSTYNGPGDYDDEAKALVIDSLGNIYVTGTSYGSGTSWDYATIKYDPNGDELWVRRYDGGGYSSYKTDDARDIAIDSFGNVYVTGTSRNNLSNGYDYATVKYDPNGNEIWVARYNGPASDYDNVHDITVDVFDNVYVTGQSKGVGTDNDYATIKYNPGSNVPVWVARYNGPDDDYDEAEVIATDVYGNTYVAGRSAGSGTHYDYATVKYDRNGNEIWVIRYDGPASAWDVPHAIAVDDSGNVYVTGNSTDSGTGSDYATFKYSAADYICTTEMTGDWNNDCKVDFVDLAEIVSHWLECNLEPPEACWE